MGNYPSNLGEIVRQIGHQSVHASVYSHPRLGVAASVSWGVWEGSENVRSHPQVKMERDTAMRDWREALDLLEQCIAVARRQLDLFDAGDK